jgi:hypothetical protein
MGMKPLAMAGALGEVLRYSWERGYRMVKASLPVSEAPRLGRMFARSHRVMYGGFNFWLARRGENSKANYFRPGPTTVRALPEHGETTPQVPEPPLSACHARLLGQANATLSRCGSSLPHQEPASPTGGIWLGHVTAQWPCPVSTQEFHARDEALRLARCSPQGSTRGTEFRSPSFKTFRCRVHSSPTFSYATTRPPVRQQKGLVPAQASEAGPRR